MDLGSKVDKKLPKHLNGPEGSVTGVTMKSVQLISSGLNRLNEITENYSYRNVNLLFSLTLDVGHFHLSKHFKSIVLSMQQYCCQFGSTVKESMKRISRWSAHYYTGKNWFQPPDNAIYLKDMPLFEKETIKKLEHSKIEIMRNWAAVNGKAVRQRPNRQQTTMAAAGTIPMSIYKIEKTENINQVKVVFFLQVLQAFQLPSSI